MIRYPFKRVIKPVLSCFFLLLFSTGLLSFTTIPEKKGGGNKKELLFSAVSGTTSKPDTISWAVKKNAAISAVKLAGNEKNEFVIISSDINGKRGNQVIVVFKPAKGKVGIAKARLIALNADGEILQEIALTGLSAKGLEGENEPPLSRVFEALGYRINLGWTSLANHCKPQMQGDEIAAGIFKKAGKGPVNITPVARYSPDFELPFGYYTNELKGPEKHPVGALAQAGRFPEHQALFPRMEGNRSFDPGKAQFGFYVSGPDHAAYSEDLWNMVYHTKNVAHATRVYQAKDKDDKIIANAYFICFEEASNGDYNDYVFLVCQIQEGDVGDFWLIGNTTIEVDGKRNEPKDYATLPKKKDAENPTGQWNTLEILSYDGKCIHVLNGEVVNYGKNASVRSGRILLQSEYAEIYYKNVMIRELNSRE